MSRSAIFVSDFHLGRRDELDDFVQENETAFAKFLEEKPSESPGSPLDLVLLGDLLDIWQVATEKEKMAAESTLIDIDVTGELETNRVKEIITAHPQCFQALRKFLEDDPSNRRIFCIPGNHDHSLVLPDVQQIVRNAVTIGSPALAEKILFPLYYDEPELFTYAEHGNQLDDNNSYEAFPEFGPECAGFYFVRLFWNRLEMMEPNADIWAESFAAILKNRLWNLIGPAYRLYRQYRRDPRPFKRIDVPGVPFFAEDGRSLDAPVTGKTLPDFPELLFSDGGDPEHIFSTDVETENRLRKLYHDPEGRGFKEEIGKILEEKYPGTEMSVPEQPVVRADHFGLLPDPYVTGVEGMFADPGGSPQTPTLKGGALSQDQYRYVLMGHTHHEKKKTLSALGVTYYNTGSWSVRLDENGRNQSRLCYVVIQKAPDGTVRATQDNWPRT